jgi:predicted nucleic acid-binding protein
MTTAIDTNVIVALWDANDAISMASQSALDDAMRDGNLVVPAPVYSELLACPGRDERFLDHFFSETALRLDWVMGEPVWRTAGKAFQSYAARRKQHSTSVPRRILADFLVGAYAVENGCQLLTLDERIYRASFPELKIRRV